MNSAEPIPLVVIGGPTAAGKTALIEAFFSPNNAAYPHLAGRAEVINADSAQVYADMAIGTAAPSPLLQASIPHHLLHDISPHREFSVADFVPAADRLIRAIFSRGKMPVVAGGTAFFIKHLLYGLPPTPPTDARMRQHFQRRCEHEGSAALLAELAAIDPKRAAQLHPNDCYRIIRALEIHAASGRPPTSFSVCSTLRPEYNPFIVLVDAPRSDLYNRIIQRVHTMMQDGLPQEVARLYRQGCRIDDPGMKAIGYREFFAECPDDPASADIQKTTDMIIMHTKHYAKRQQTFFKQFTAHAALDVTVDDEKKSAYRKLVNFFSLYGLAQE